jgi:ABC-type polysaccharide/polyol phosphate transport system ATPase subunit
MSSERIAIRLEHVSKRYRAGRSRTLVDVVAAALDRARGREHHVYSAVRGRTASTIFALNDVTFDVAEGTGLGIIGPNGAGKTSLLKLISRVTWPTSGRVRVAGRVVSLIELGAGFHPELTGRENVYLGAGLFGLTRRDIDERFDDIVGFAEVEPLIDMPMKRYSSGLYARLGFSVAIHSNPDIVLVDEVLAVGDAAFRRRALESLRRLIADGRTVLFISHDLWNVRRLCDRIVWMDEGRVRAFGDAAAIADRYIEEVNVRAIADRDQRLQSHRGGTGEIRYAAIEVVGCDGRPAGVVSQGERLVVRAAYDVSEPVGSPIFQIAIVDVDTGVIVTSASSSAADAPRLVDGPGAIDCAFESLPLRPRQYALRLSITDTHQLMSYDVVTAGPRFTVVSSANPRRDDPGDADGIVTLPFRFEHHVGVAS